MIFTKHAFERLAWRSSLTTDRVLELISNDELHRVVGKDRSGELHTLFYDIIDNEMYVMIHENNEVITVMTYVQHQGQSRFIIDQSVVDDLRATATYWHENKEPLKVAMEKARQAENAERQKAQKLPTWKLKCQIMNEDTKSLKILTLGSLTAKNANSITVSELVNRLVGHLLKTPNSYLIDVWSIMGSQLQRSEVLHGLASRAFIDAKRIVMRKLHNEKVQEDDFVDLEMAAMKNVSQEEIDKMIFDKFEKGLG